MDNHDQPSVVVALHPTVGVAVRPPHRAEPSHQHDLPEPTIAKPHNVTRLDGRRFLRVVCHLLQPSVLRVGVVP